jgi:hypothetical protein
MSLCCVFDHLLYFPNGFLHYHISMIVVQAFYDDAAAVDGLVNDVMLKQNDLFYIDREACPPGKALDIYEFHAGKLPNTCGFIQ